MTEKRYYQKNYGEEYYIFDSNTISEDEFEERVEYEGYNVFADSLTGSEIIDLLNENEQLKQSNEYLQGQLDDYSGVEVDNIELRNENEQLKEDRNKLFIRERDARNNWRKLKYENEELKKEIKELESDVIYFEKTYEIEERGLNCVPEMCTITSNTPSRRELFKYNKELEQRNKRQYNQLNKLWKLIETKDWETLTEMDNQMKKDEEQLQSEWKCYE